MRTSWVMTATAALALTACGQQSEPAAMYESVEVTEEAAAVPADAPTNEFGFSQAMEAGPFSGSGRVAESVTSVDIAEPDVEVSSPDAVEPDAAVAAPQIAYRYEMGFRLPAAAMKPLQERHADMCVARGPQVCRIIAMRQSDSDGDYAYGSLQLAVAASEAREFSKALEAGSESSDAELISSSIVGEDLSKQIVDTEAKLRARTLLRDRLMDILRSRNGTVAELVEAERGVAQVNQEIDQARSWLNEMRGRVAFSNMAITYESGTRTSGGFVEPIRNAWASLGAILGSMIAFLMLALTVLVPIGLVVFGAVKLLRLIRPRIVADSPVEPASAEE